MRVPVRVVFAAVAIAALGRAAPAAAQTGWRSPTGRYGPGTIVYRESAGGVGGARAEIVLAPDGSVRYDSTTHGSFRGRLTRSEYEGFIGMVAAARVLDLPDVLPAGPTAIADQMTAQVSYTWAGATKTVTSQPGSHEPDAFFQLREELRALARRLRDRTLAASPPAGLGAPPSRAPTAALPPSGVATSVQLELARRGGLDAADERLVVEPSGLAALTARAPAALGGTFTNARPLDAAEHRRLLQLLARSDIGRLPPHLPTRGAPVAGATETTVTASTPHARASVASRSDAFEPAGFAALRVALEEIANGLRQPYGKGPIAYAVSGGFPEANDVVQIDENGVARLASAASQPAVQLAPDEHAALVAALADARFLELPDRIERAASPGLSLESLAGPDRAVQHAFGGLAKSVAIERGATPTAEAAALLARLESIRQRLRAQTPLGIPGLPREAIGLERLLRGVIGRR